MSTITFVLLLSLLIVMGQSVVIYTSGSYSMKLTDNSNGAVPASTTQNQVNIFFRIYPGMAAGYSNAPTTVAITFDPTLAQGSLGVSSTGISMSVANLQASPNDTSYMQFGLNYMLSNFYTAGPTTTTQKATTTTASSSGGLSSFQQLMLNTHNNYRSLIAKGGSVRSAGGVMPSAANMNQLSYSTDLESKALAWAQQCVVGHTPGNNGYGQNFCASSGQESNFTSFFIGCAQMWWNEVAKFPSNTDMTLYMDSNFENIGHFTQMAWHDTKTVGCAITACPGVGTLLFCDYDHGNVPNYTIYDAGSSCGECTSGCNNGLCIVTS